MAYTGFPFPYDVGNLLVGAVRILYAPTTVTKPTGIHDVIDPQTPYAAKTGWEEFGATRDSFTYNRGFDTSGLEIQQTSAVLFEEITSISRSISTSMAELTPKTLALMEGRDPATDPGTASAAGAADQGVIEIGSFSTLERYRFAFLARRNVGSGLVTESGGTTRGRFVMGVLYQAQMAADDASLEFDKGTLLAASVTFTAFPDDSVTLADENFGAWFFENVDTIT